MAAAPVSMPTKAVRHRRRHLGLEVAADVVPLLGRLELLDVVLDRPDRSCASASRNRNVTSFDRSVTRSPTTMVQRAPGPRRCSIRSVAAVGLGGDGRSSGGIGERLELAARPPARADRAHRPPRSPPVGRPRPWPAPRRRGRARASSVGKPLCVVQHLDRRVRRRRSGGATTPHRWNGDALAVEVAGVERLDVAPAPVQVGLRQGEHDARAGGSGLARGSRPRAPTARRRRR